VEMTIDRTATGFDDVDPAFTERVRINQRKRAAELKSHYDFIVCGSGSSGSILLRSSSGRGHLLGCAAVAVAGARRRRRPQLSQSIRKTLGECS
jgi:hypothetical protein